MAAMPAATPASIGRVRKRDRGSYNGSYHRRCNSQSSQFVTHCFLLYSAYRPLLINLNALRLVPPTLRLVGEPLGTVLFLNKQTGKYLGQELLRPDEHAAN